MFKINETDSTERIDRARFAPFREKFHAEINKNGIKNRTNRFQKENSIEPIKLKKKVIL